MYQKILETVGEGLLRSAAQRVFIEDDKIPYKYYRPFEGLFQRASTYANMFSDVDLKKPATIQKAVGTLSKHVIAKPEKHPDPINEYLRKTQYILDAPSSLEWLLDWHLNRARIKVEMETEGGGVLARVFVGEGEGKSNSYLVKYVEQGKEVDFYKFHFMFLNTTMKKIAAEYWKEHKHIVVDVDDDGDFVVTEAEFSDREYHGESLAWVLSLKRYADRGIRRVVVLQGTPGTGKSTLCENVAKKLSNRTVVLTNKLIMKISKSDWEFVMKIMSPELVIADDIDRCDRSSLEKSLFMFEDQRYNVPLTLFTTNDQTQLPPAYRRPGRIDVIWDMPKPSEEIQMQMIAGFCESMGVDFGELPDDKVKMLCNIMRNDPDMSGAFGKELLTRMIVEGYDYIPPENDIVFGNTFKSYRQ